MTSINATLPDDPHILKGMIVELTMRYERQIDLMLEEIRLLRALRFGRKSEKLALVEADNSP